MGNQGANFNCHPSNIVVNCLSIYIMVILDNSRTLGPPKGNQGYCIIKILFLYLHREINIKLCLLFNQIQSKLLKRIL